MGAASKIPAFTSEQLEYLATLSPSALAALIGQTKPAQPLTLPKIGDAVEGRGVYLGEWAGVHAYAAEDFLRDAKGEQLLLSFNRAREEFAKRNGGWEAGNGTEAAIRAEIAKGGKDFEGKLIIPPLELVNSYNLRGSNNPHTDANIYALMNKGALPKIATEVQNGVGDQRWALSGSEHPGGASSVSHVRLTDGGDGWYRKNSSCSGVVPVRLYRQQAAAGPAPQVGG